MKKTHRPREHSEAQLSQLASADGALLYETQMLNWAADRFEMTEVDSLETAILHNMVIECFLIHFRNLRDFLYPDLKLVQPDDVLASDYDSRWGKTHTDWKQCSASERERINKLLSHISYSRGKLDRSWLVIPAMRQRLMESVAQFTRNLSPERRKWFAEWPPFN
jgi:hypothetical protein